MEKIATYSQTNYLCNKYGLRAKKGYGQNFIIDYNIVDHIARAACNEDDCVIEIGPGIGALTQPLALRAKQVYSFEIDQRCITVLEESLKDLDNVKVIYHDFLDVDVQEIVDVLKKEYHHVKVASNLPYYITTPLLFKLFEVDGLDAITVMMQKEVANRFVALENTKDYNALSVMAQYLFDVKLIMNVPASIFNPKPKVDSAVIQFIPKNTRHPLQNPHAFFNFVRACFAQRRKTLMNNIKNAKYDTDQVSQWLQKHQLNQNLRSEQFTLEQFIELYEWLN